MAQEFKGGAYASRTVVTDGVTRRQIGTLNQRIIGRDLPGQRWDVSLALFAHDNQALKRKVFAHQLRQGFSRPFLLPMPQDASLPEIPTGSVALSAKASAAADEVQLSDTTKKLYEGQYVGFAGHPKVYCVMDDWQSGGGSLSIYPTLQTDVASGAVMTLEPNLYAVYQSGVAFGVDPLTKRAARYIEVLLSEYLG